MNREFSDREHQRPSGIQYQKPEAIIVTTPEELKVIVFSAVQEAMHNSHARIKDVMTPVEAADYIGKKEATLRKWRCCKQGPEYSKSATGAIYYRRKVLDAWLAVHQVRTIDGVSYAF